MAWVFCGSTSEQHGWVPGTVLGFSTLSNIQAPVFSSPWKKRDRLEPFPDHGIVACAVFLFGSIFVCSYVLNTNIEKLSLHRVG